MGAAPPSETEIKRYTRQGAVIAIVIYSAYRIYSAYFAPTEKERVTAKINAELKKEKVHVLSGEELNALVRPRFTPAPANPQK